MSAPSVHAWTRDPSWATGHHTTIARPWWHVPADIVVLAVTLAVVIGCLVVGQQLQQQRCAAQVGTTQACAGSVTR